MGTTKSSAPKCIIELKTLFSRKTRFEHKEMIKHIVLFKLRDDVEKSVKATRLPDIRNQFLALHGVIPTLRSIEIGLNCNEKEKFDLALVATFDDLAGLSAYATDPRHVAVAKQVGEMLDVRACTDYEI